MKRTLVKGLMGTTIIIATLLWSGLGLADDGDGTIPLRSPETPTAPSESTEL